MYDVVIVGAGLAGLQLARLLARGGASVLLADRRRRVTDCIRTTGIFVRKTFEEFSSLDRFLGPPIRAIGLHSAAGRSIEMTSGHDEFRVGRMAPLYESMLRQSIAAGAEWSPSTSYESMRFDGDATEVRFRGGATVRTRFVAGADGGRSRVGRDLGLDGNGEFIVGLEDVFPSTGAPTRTSAVHGAPRFDCWIDAEIAPGYLAWIVDDGEEMHVGVGGDPKRFDPGAALQAFERRMGLTSATAIGRRGGLIPVNGVLRRIGCERGLLVGDAAGAVSPLTAGGLDACMRLSAHAARVLLEALFISGPAALRAYDGAAFRSRFASRIAMRRIFAAVTRVAPLVEIGFALGRTTAVRALVRHVFFGRGSFPDLPHPIAEPSGAPR